MLLLAVRTPAAAPAAAPSTGAPCHATGVDAPQNRAAVASAVGFTPEEAAVPAGSTAASCAASVPAVANMASRAALMAASVAARLSVAKAAASSGRAWLSAEWRGRHVAMVPELLFSIACANSRAALQTYKPPSLSGIFCAAREERCRMPSPQGTCRMLPGQGRGRNTALTQWQHRHTVNNSIEQGAYQSSGARGHVRAGAPA
jgi:hypothetical protein